MHVVLGTQVVFLFTLMLIGFKILIHEDRLSSM